MRRGKSGHTCPKCGQQGKFLLAGGEEARFERPELRYAAAAGTGVLLLVLAAVIAGAGWYWRADIAARLPEARRAQAGLAEGVRPPEAPAFRPDRLAAFGDGLSEEVLAVIGTGAEDRLLAFSPLSNGEIALVTQALPEDGGGAVSFVRMGGREGLAVHPVAGAGPVMAASLAPAGLGGARLALTHDREVRLLAFGAGGGQLWERRMDHAGRDGPPASVTEGGGLAYLLAPAEAPGRLSFSAWDEAGRRLWERSFEASEGARAYTGALPEGGAYAVFETFRSASGAEATAVFLTDAGEIRRQSAPVRLPGRLAGAGLAAGGLALLASGEAPGLLSLAADGGVTGPLPLPDAPLSGAVFLAALPGQAPVIVSSYPLAGIRTGLTLSRPAGDGALEPLRYRLPPESRVTGAAALGARSVMIAGLLGEGAAADAFLMIAGFGEDTAAGAGAVPGGPAADGLPGPGK